MMFRAIFSCAILSGGKLSHFETFPHIIKSRSTSSLLCLMSCNKNVPKCPAFFFPSRLAHSQNLSHSNTSLDSSISENKESNLLSVNVDQDVIDKNVENNKPELFECIDFEEITGGDEEILTKFKLLLLEVDVMRQDGMRVPKNMSTNQWKELFSLDRQNQRNKYLNYLWLTEIRKESDKRKKQEKKLEIMKNRTELDIKNQENDHIKYGFRGSTIFIRIYETTMNTFYNNRLVQAMQFGQNIVIDCGFDKNMTLMENKLCAKQLNYLFSENRLNSEPFNLQFCNVNRESVQFQQFKRIIPTMDSPGFPMNIREEHYLDLYPKEKLVYLTPHCRYELKNFDHDDIYIIGALVDRQNSEPFTLAKAKSEGIRMASLPLDRYLDWSLGTKSLTINQVLAILLDLRTTGDWNIALKHVPKRKIRLPGEPVKESRKRRVNIFQPHIFNTQRNRFY